MEIDRFKFRDQAAGLSRGRNIEGPPAVMRNNHELAPTRCAPSTLSGPSRATRSFFGTESTVTIWRRWESSSTSNNLRCLVYSAELSPGVKGFIAEWSRAGWTIDFTNDADAAVGSLVDMAGHWSLFVIVSVNISQDNPFASDTWSDDELIKMAQPAAMVMIDSNGEVLTALHRNTACLRSQDIDRLKANW